MHASAPTQVWQQEAAEMMQKMEGVVELKALESLVSQASKLPVSLPDVKVRLRPHLAVWRLPLILPGWLAD